jgi:predicted transcriptional regulator
MFENCAQENTCTIANIGVKPFFMQPMMDLKSERDKLAREVIENSRRFAQLMRKSRMDRGLKASWVASQMGLSASYICDLEHGRRIWNKGLGDRYMQAIGEQTNNK